MIWRHAGRSFGFTYNCFYIFQQLFGIINDPIFDGIFNAAHAFYFTIFVIQFYCARAIEDFEVLERVFIYNYKIGFLPNLNAANFISCAQGFSAFQGCRPDDFKRMKAGFPEQFQFTDVITGINEIRFVKFPEVSNT